MSTRPILLVEDNPDDVELTRIAFAQANIANPLHVVDNGVEALDYLFGRGAWARQPRHEAPALILLDLNMPRMDGREVLQAIRADAETCSLPVVVITTSAEPFDVEACYLLGANSYIRKPVDFDQFMGAVKQVGMYWLVLNHPRE